MKKKKSMVMLILAVCLVMVIGAGATLAYLTDVTEVKANTFTVGKVEASLKEYSDENGEKEWVDATDGKNLIPGATVWKKPIMTIEAKSAECYAFLKVEGADALVANEFTINGWSKDWTKIEPADGDSLDGVYVYKEKVPASTTPTALSALFQSVTCTNNVETAGLKAGGINIIGCAVQAAGMKDAKAALEEAPGEFKNAFAK